MVRTVKYFGFHMMYLIDLDPYLVLWPIYYGHGTEVNPKRDPVVYLDKSLAEGVDASCVFIIVVLLNEKQQNEKYRTYNSIIIEYKISFCMGNNQKGLINLCLQSMKHIVDFGYH